jgi:hypothetical protein
VNDDELGRALATALAAPDVQAAPDAGAKLRARARRQQTRQWLVGGALTAVLAVLVALGAVRAAPASDPAPVAAGPSLGHSLLRVPLAVQLDPPCPKASTCAPLPVLTIDEVRAVRVIDLPERGAVVEVTLTGDDDRTVARTPLPQQADLTAGAGALSYPATYRPGTLRIRVPTPRLADQLVALLGPYEPVARTGPGRLDRPLQVWLVVGSGGPLCSDIDGVPHTLAVNRPGECLLLTGPAVTIDAADVRVVPPTAGVGGDWVVSLVPSGPARRALADWSARHVGRRVAVGIDGRLVGPAPVLAGGLWSLEIPVADRDAAVAVVSRMRP